MCVIIFKPSDESWPGVETLDDAYWQNSDGFGLIAQTRKGTVRAEKGLFDTHKIERVLDLTAKSQPALAHWRFATHGLINDKNCHPFRGLDWHLVHNGVLPNPWGASSGSDTVAFVRTIEHLPFSQLLVMKKRLEKAIRSNRMAIMSDSGEVLLLNEDYGEWHEGLWYSNSNLIGPSWYERYEKRHKRFTFQKRGGSIDPWDLWDDPSDSDKEYM